VEHVVFLRRKDNGLAKDYHSGHLTKLMSTMIRLLRPYAIVTFCPGNLTSINSGAEHPDHRYGALALWDAVYPDARQEEKVPWWKFWWEPLPGHKVSEVLWFGDDLVTPYSANCVLRTDSVWTPVCDALRAHTSQWDEDDILDNAAARMVRTAKKWGYGGLAEEYHRVVIPY
jgi:LmbE family N-acetylglucosaminyl deacetylase